MNIAIYAVELALMAALIGVLVTRQVKGQYADPRSLWKAPVVIAAVGVATLPVTATGFGIADAMLIAIELAVTVLIGMGMGALTTASVVHDDKRDTDRVRIRSGWRGAALWIVFIAVRLALRPVATSMDAQFVTSVGLVLVLVAVARAVTARMVIPKIIAVSPATMSKGAVGGSRSTD